MRDRGSMQKDIGVAVIGLGWMGQVHSRGYRRLFDQLANQPADTQAFIQQHLQGRRFTTVAVTGITRRITVEELGWVFVEP